MQKGKKSTISNSNSKSVRLPSNMPLRTVRKADYERKELDKLIQEAFYKVAFYSAICFILVGSTISFSGVYQVDSDRLRAELSSGNDNNAAATDETTKTNVVQSTETEFYFIDNLPSNLDSDENIDFYLSNSRQVAAAIKVPGVVGLYDLPVKEVSENKYRVEIQPAYYPNNYYELRVYIWPADGSFPESEFSEMFFLGTQEQEREFLQNNDKPRQATPKADYTREQTERVIDPEIISTNQQAMQTRTVYARLPVDTSSATLLARSANEGTEFVVSSGKERYGSWLFPLNLRLFTIDASYTFRVKGETLDGTVYTDSVRYQVYRDDSFTPSDEFDRLDFYPEPEDSDFQPSITVEADTMNQTSELLKAKKDKLAELSRQYFEALSEGNEQKAEQIRGELRSLREQISYEASIDVKTKDISHNIDAELENKFAELEKRIQVYTNIKQAKNSGNNNDTDGDGITDYDEVNLFQSDPSSNDTDGDGIPDGEALTRGLNPAASTTDARLVYESPKNTFGLQIDDSLKVQALSLESEESASGTKKRTVISGKALPNSYATIYIFSTPVVVTIRTDSDGSFTYTYDRELEDGRHDIYVTVTNNKGSIMAQSNPFSFIKEAEAYSVIEETTDQEVEVATGNTMGNPYRAAIGTGILALGIILLMLGVGIRGRKSDKIELDDEAEEIKLTSEDSNLTDDKTRVKDIKPL